MTIEEEEKFIKTRMDEIMFELYSARTDLYELGIIGHKFEAFLVDSLKRFHKLQQEIS
jgi:hypothetical protein